MKEEGSEEGVSDIGRDESAVGRLLKAGSCPERRPKSLAALEALGVFRTLQLGHFLPTRDCRGIEEPCGISGGGDPLQM